MCTLTFRDTGKTISFDSISSILRERKAFLSAGVATADLYDLGKYCSSSQQSGERHFALMDRNLVSRLSELVRGHQIVRGQANEIIYRTAAASMAFFHFAEIQVEFNIATYEFAASMGHETAINEIEDSRVADNLDPFEFVKIAIGDTDSLNLDHVEQIRISLPPSPVEEKNFEKPLTYWNTYYVYALKLVELFRDSDLSRIAKIEKYLKWQTEEAMWSSIGAIWALFHFSQSSHSKRFKKINSLNPVTLTKNLKNEVWDMCYIGEWKRKLSNSNDVWILNTQDQNLHEIACYIFDSSDSSKNPTKTLENLVLKLYDAIEAKQIFNLFLKYDNEVSGFPGRKKHLKKFYSELDNIKCRLEKNIGIDRC